MDAAPSPASRPVARMRVLASGSGGNCTLIVSGVGRDRTVCLIDLGLGLRRTRELLREEGLDLQDVQSVLITHLDGDHFRPQWVKWLPGDVRVHIHERHARLASRRGLIAGDRRFCQHRCGPISLGPGVIADAVEVAHDHLGTVAFRFTFEPPGGAAGTLGFATDIGHVTDAFVDHFRNVGVMAIESNYCPKLQAASGRSAALLRRIMGGWGHLSNEQCVDALARIEPAHQAVLLHLSRECNTPALATAGHAGRSYRTIAAVQHAATPWIGVMPADERQMRKVVTRATLFDPLSSAPS